MNEAEFRAKVAEYLTTLPNSEEDCEETYLTPRQVAESELDAFHSVA